MNAPTSTLSLAGSTPDDPLDLNVVVVYENFSAGRRALALLSAINRSLHAEISLRPNLWRFDLLNHRQFRDQAALAADHAELLLISADSCTELPAPVTTWIADCRARRPAEASALIQLNASDHADTLSLESDAGVYTASRPYLRADPTPRPDSAPAIGR